MIVVIAVLDCAHAFSLFSKDCNFSFPNEIIEILLSSTPKEVKKDLTEKALLSPNAKLYSLVPLAAQWPSIVTVIFWFAV